MTGYVVYFGTSPGVYPGSFDAGAKTTAVVPGLTNGVRYYFVVKAHVGGGFSSASNEVSGFPTNTAPSIVNPGNMTRREGSFTIAVVGSDPDGDPLTYSATGLPAGAAINPSTGVISGVATAGTYVITAKVHDGALQASTTFSLTVGPNGTPTITSPGNQANDTNDVVSLQLVASDPEGDQLTFSVTNLPPGLALNAGTGRITGTPLSGSAGTYPVTATVSDGAAAASVQFTWAIIDPQSGGLVGHWLFDEGTGTTSADAAGGRTATLANGALWTSGRSGSAVQLDGVNDHVSVAAFDVPGSGLTISAWVRNVSLNSEQSFIAKASGSSRSAPYWTLGVVHGGAPRLRFQLRTGTTTTTLTAPWGDLPLGVWYHAAATYDGGIMRLYLNNVLIAATPKTGSIAQDRSAPVAIGRSPDGSAGNYLYGAIDDVRIYARALNLLELSSVMAGGGVAASSPLLSSSAAGMTGQTSPALMTSDPTSEDFIAASMSIVEHTDAAADTLSMGLHAHWDLDESVGTAVVDSVEEMVGTLANGAQWAPGVEGTAVAFDGIDDYVALPPFEAPTKGLSIAAWVETSSVVPGKEQHFVSKASDATEAGHSWTLGILKDGGPRLGFRLTAGGITRTIAVPDDVLPASGWYHVAATYDGAMMRLYLNGVPVAAAPASGPVADDPGALVTIGRNAAGAKNTHMHGSIDALRIYSRGLSEDEIGILVDGSQ